MVHAETWPRYCVLHGLLDKTVHQGIIESMKSDRLIDAAGTPLISPGKRVFPN